MERLSFFGPPAKSFQRGGAHVAVYLVAVYQQQLVAYDVDAPGVKGRFLPWTVLAFGGNPYADASLLVDDWCQVMVSSLKLADAIGGHRQEGSEELAIVFRAELTDPPAGDENRQPVLLPHDEIAAIHPFPAEELRRWVAAPGDDDHPPGDGGGHIVPPQPEGPRLVF